MFILQCYISFKGQPILTRLHLLREIKPFRLSVPLQESSSKSFCRFTKAIHSAQYGYVMPSATFLYVLKVVLGIENKTFQYQR